MRGNCKATPPATNWLDGGRLGFPLSGSAWILPIEPPLSLTPSAFGERQGCSCFKTSLNSCIALALVISQLPCRL